jgi:DNA-binding NarL/FixJ family response regulator
MDEIRILIVDDHTLFRQGIYKMLEMEEDFLVVGEASTGKEACDQAIALMPGYASCENSILHDV